MSNTVTSPTSDPFPSHLSIEIDRVRLRNYLRMSRLLLWTLSLSMFGALMGFCLSMDFVQPGDFQLLESAWIVATRTGMTIGTAALLGALGYLIFNHRRIPRYCNSLEVSVEGSFLRIREGDRTKLDRKTHFRSIVDYTTYQDSLMRREGITSLRMATTGGGSGSIISVLGIKDCQEVRDKLSEIDRLRENH